MTTRFLACQDVVELVTDYLERALTPDETERVELHLTMCGACVEYLEQMRTAVMISGALGDSDADSEVTDRLLLTFRRFRSS